MQMILRFTCPYPIQQTRIPLQQECTRLESCLTDIHLWIKQVHRVVRSAYFHLRSIGLGRKMLTVAAAKQLVPALVISRLDYCNSLLTGIPTSLTSRLEMVQHQAARLILRSSGHQSVTVLMKDLHWLPVTSRVLFKVLVLVYKCRNGLDPGYLTSMLSAYTPVHGLRSASYGLVSSVF